MAVLTNVFRRGGVYYFRARVPASLSAKVGRRELWRSLRTREISTARRRGSALFGLTEALWRDLQHAMRPDEVQLLIDGWVLAKLDEDAEARQGADRESLQRHNDKQMEAFGASFLRLCLLAAKAEPEGLAAAHRGLPPGREACRTRIAGQVGIVGDLTTL
jgi:hypothetical protein